MKKVDHIGIAVKSIDEALGFYTETLGFRCTAVEDVTSQQVRVAFIDANNVKIELLEPLNGSGPISKFIENRGEGLHHIALGVNSIDDRISEMKEKGIHMVDDAPKEGAGQSLVAFMHPKSAHGVLYELCEKVKMEEK